MVSPDTDGNSQRESVQHLRAEIARSKMVLRDRLDDLSGVVRKSAGRAARLTAVTIVGIALVSGVTALALEAMVRRFVRRRRTRLGWTWK
jgi:hypothetical protein